MYDDTYHFIPTQGWMYVHSSASLLFSLYCKRQVPLVDYHLPGADSRFEPLSENILDYEWALAQYLGAGVAACYRGFELYDSPATRTMVHYGSFSFL
jgi:hypothetical protein